MNKMLKTIACCMLILSVTTIKAAALDNTAIYDSEYAGPDSPIKLGPRVDEMTPAQMEEAGIVDPFANEKGQIQSRAYIGKLAYIVGRHNVYDSASGGRRIGFVSSRERVYVYNDDDSRRYYIRFLDYGRLRDGYVDKRAVKVPSSGWEAPIVGGRISQDYAGRTRHTGIDVATYTGTDVYAVADGQYRSIVYYGFPTRGIKKLVNYGNYVEGNVQGDINGRQQSVKVIYAHLSDFENGAADNTTQSHRQEYSKGAVNKEVVSEFYAYAGERLGGVGNTGWSTGPHLHFEVRNSWGSVQDPFRYVVFPSVGY